MRWLLLWSSGSLLSGLNLSSCFYVWICGHVLCFDDTYWLCGRELCADIFYFLPPACLFPSRLHLLVCCSLLLLCHFLLDLVCFVLSISLTCPFLRPTCLFSSHLHWPLVAPCYFYVISLYFIYSLRFSSLYFCLQSPPSPTLHLSALIPSVSLTLILFHFPRSDSSPFSLSISFNHLK